MVLVFAFSSDCCLGMHSVHLFEHVVLDAVHPSMINILCSKEELAQKEEMSTMCVANAHIRILREVFSSDTNRCQNSRSFLGGTESATLDFHPL